MHIDVLIVKYLALGSENLEEWELEENEGIKKATL